MKLYILIILIPKISNNKINENIFEIILFILSSKSSIVVKINTD